MSSDCNNQIRIVGECGNVKYFLSKAGIDTWGRDATFLAHCGRHVWGFGAVSNNMPSYDSTIVLSKYFPTITFIHSFSSLQYEFSGYAKFLGGIKIEEFYKESAEHALFQHRRKHGHN
jgi:hypothetical protein